MYITHLNHEHLVLAVNVKSRFSIYAVLKYVCHNQRRDGENMIFLLCSQTNTNCAIQLEEVLSQRRKELKANQKTTLDQLQREHEADIENTRQCYRAEVQR